MTRQAPRHPATTLAANLQAVRKGSDLTQRQLADALGVDAITVSRWERGASRPGDVHLMRLCEHFSVTLAELYTEPEEAAA